MLTMTSCGICGYDNVANTLFCEECGATLTPPVAPAPPPPQSAPLFARVVERPVTGGIEAARPGEQDAEAPAITDAPGPDGAAPRATATYLTSESGRRLEVPAQDVVIVGREDMRSGIRPDVDLTLDGASAAGVSRRHCRLLRGVDGWRVEDLMSTNYTVLNGKALPAHTPTLVRDGDELRLGKLRLRFHER